MKKKLNLISYAQSKRPTQKRISVKRKKKLKLYWTFSNYAWLAGIKPFKGSERIIPVPPVERLSKRLLKIGGEKVCVAFHESHGVTNAIVKLGAIEQFTSIKVQRGGPDTCHCDIGRLWMLNKDTSLIVLGYALSDDNVWRRRSWLLDSSGQLTDTIDEAKKYFGMFLTKGAAELFCKDPL